MTTIPIALTIAGSDSGGGAGIQADLKSFSANHVYGASVVTALTAQNTVGVSAIHDVPAEFINAQLDAVFSDLQIEAVKIGMLSQAPVIETVAQALVKHDVEKVVLDPVMVATSGDVLLAEDAIHALKSELVPKAVLITPNMHEAAKLTDSALAEDEQAIISQSEMLLDAGAQAVLIKGGHGNSKESADLLATPNDFQWYRSPRIETRNTHGTGCSLSSAIAANLARGNSLEDAVGKAKIWLTGALQASDQLKIGTGSGPVHHFHEIWRN
ncbi:MAG: bifunctional hydroxymethylpyrimidine kinase/phosphomethylpyrimidine kinase [Pseudomonadota bacterium]